MDDPINREEQNLQDLAALFNDREITDQEGNVTEGEETPGLASAASEEETSEEKTPTAEKPAEETKPATQASEDSTEPELGVDEAGKRYVPEKRFKDIYGKYKATDRELQTLREQLDKGNALLEATKSTKSKLPAPERSIDKADLLELKLTLPQFDPKFDENGVPTNPNYSPDLDELGFQIWKANPNISLVDAGRQALRYAKSLGSSQQEARTEARQIKSIQADQGITGRVSHTSSQPVDPSSMTDKEMEAWLKANGQW